MTSVTCGSTRTRCPPHFEHTRGSAGMAIAANVAAGTSSAAKC